MSALFSPVELRGLKLNNRVVVSPMCQYSAFDGNANDWHLMNLGQYAMGAAALVVTEATHVSDVGRISPRCLGLYSDDNERELKRVVDFCKQYGVSAIGTQLAHAGRKASTKIPLDGGGAIAPDEPEGWQTLGACSAGYADWPAPLELDRAGLEQVKAEFVEATLRSERIGFDLIEVHGAHGYLMHQFCSPLSNLRTDEYGGSLENRIRFPLEVFSAMRAVWPDDKPMGMRITGSDWVDGGWAIDDAIALAGALKEIGCDFVDVTSGGLDPRQDISVGPSYQVPFAEAVRKATGLNTWAVGMITEAQQAEDIVASGQADMIAMAREMMRNPRWAQHAAVQLGAEADWPAQFARAKPGAARNFQPKHDGKSLR